ncbi:MAG: heme NO-binding domain-containing protein [Gemmatimonadota bacterium]
MSATVFGLVREILQRSYGEGVWEAILRASEVNGRATSGRPVPSGPDGGEEPARPAGESDLDLPSDCLISWWGRQAIPAMSRRYPSLFSGHPNLRSFLLSLAEVIPTASETRSGPGGLALSYLTTFDGDLLLTVETGSGLCPLLKGVVVGAAEAYAEPVALEELKCMKRGDNRCVLRVATVIATQAGPHEARTGRRVRHA